MKRHQIVLLTVIMTVSVMALLAIIYVPMYGTTLVRSAAMSPVGRLALLLMVGGVVTVGLLCLVLRRCTTRPHAPIRSFFSDEGGTAAVEMLLALPIILIIVLILLQATIMWNANLVFHYAVYGTARSMASVIPSYLDESGEDHCMMYAMGDQENSSLSPDSLKYYQIRLAAVSALIPICGKLPEGVSQENPWMTGEDFALITSRALSAGGGQQEHWLNRVAEHYRWGDHFLVLAIDIPDHWNYSEPTRGEKCPYHANRREWNAGSNNWVWPPYCPNVLKGVLDYPPWEKVKIGVSFPIELNVPYAGKLLYEALDTRWPEDVESITVPGSSRTSYLLWMNKELEFILSG